MGHVTIASSLFPYRFSLTKRNEPVELKLKVTNTHVEPIMLSLSLVMPGGFGFDKTGLSREMFRRYESVRPGQTIEIVQPLYLGKVTDQGDWNARLIIDEHFHEFGTIVNSYKKDLPLRVVK
ncbi:MAG: hypothetical protein Q7S21_06765 [archaeon]|nr:hypothetical protein [archaeon]